MNRAQGFMALFLTNMIGPEPTEGIGQKDASMLQVVSAFPIDELVIPTGESQGRCHLLVCQGPVTMIIVQVITTGLQEHLHRFDRCLADPTGVDMTTSYIGETADHTADLGKFIRALPSHREGADAPRASSADRSVRRLWGQVIILANRGEDLLQQQTGVLVAQ